MTAPVRRSPELAVVESDDHAVLLDLVALDHPRPLTIDGTALAIWRAIDGVRDRDAIVAAVAAEYQLDVDVVASDVGEFLAELRRRGFLAPE